MENAYAETGSGRSSDVVQRSSLAAEPVVERPRAIAGIGIFELP